MEPVEEFLAYIQHTKRYSAHTIDAYQNDLEQFQAFLKLNAELGNITLISHHNVRDWIIELIDNGIQPKSINRKVTSLKSFFKYLLQQGTIKVSPLNKIEALKINKQLPSFLKKQEVDDLFEILEQGIGFEDKRNTLIFKLLYSTGMRRAELIGLKDSDVDVHNKTIKVLGKRSKERIIPISDSFLEEIRIYIDLKNQEEFGNLERKEPYLILTSKGKKAYPRLIYNIVHSNLTKVSTLQKRSPHIIRHSFATHLLNNGADLNAIKEILGHANLAATEVYTHTTFEKLKSVYNQAHPRASKKKED